MFRLSPLPFLPYAETRMATNFPIWPTADRRSSRPCVSFPFAIANKIPPDFQFSNRFSLVDIELYQRPTRRPSPECQLKLRLREKTRFFRLTLLAPLSHSVVFFFFVTPIPRGEIKCTGRVPILTPLPLSFLRRVAWNFSAHERWRRTLGSEDPPFISS